MMPLTQLPLQLQMQLQQITRINLPLEMIRHCKGLKPDVYITIHQQFVHLSLDKHFGDVSTDLCVSFAVSATVAF